MGANEIFLAIIGVILAIISIVYGNSMFSSMKSQELSDKKH